jgi:DNA-3-methyladenine glycosylase II
MFTEQMTLKPCTPFSFDLSAKIFSNGDKQIRNYENGKFNQLIRVNGKLILATIESKGTVDKPELQVELKADKKLSEADKKKAKEVLNMLFNLDFDLAPFIETAKQDQTMANVTWKLWGLRSPTTQTVYEALVDSIVEQQISLKVAKRLKGK